MPLEQASPTGRTEEETLHNAAEVLGVELSEAQSRQLMRYRDLLLRWNKVYNLTSIREPQEALHQHLIDCLAVASPIRRALDAQRPVQPQQALQPEPALRVLDVGSGGGLPGVVLAVLMPGRHIDCVDAVAKKVAFIRQVAAELALPNLHALHSRVEELPRPGPDGSGYGLITSRAFASLADFTNWTEHLLEPGGVWAAMKGQEPEREIRDPYLRAEVFHVEPLTPPGLNAQRCLIWMRTSNKPTSQG